MKKNRLAAVVLAAGMLLGSALPVSAADRDLITFDGDAKKFVTDMSGTVENGFEDMLPGESRTLVMELGNDSSEELKFFMSSDILQEDIAEKGDRQAVYDFTIARDGETFFAAVIGGESENNISIGKDYLTEDRNILLASLGKGEDARIEITMSLDGDSMGNAYMNTDGSLAFRFSAETPEQPPTIVTTVTKYVKGATNTVIKTVKTGDALSLAVPAAMAVSAVVILVILIKKRREREDEQA